MRCVVCAPGYTILTGSPLSVLYLCSFLSCVSRGQHSAPRKKVSNCITHNQTSLVFFSKRVISYFGGNQVTRPCLASWGLPTGSGRCCGERSRRPRRCKRPAGIYALGTRGTERWTIYHLRREYDQLRPPERSSLSNAAAPVKDDAYYQRLGVPLTATTAEKSSRPIIGKPGPFIRTRTLTTRTPPSSSTITRGLPGIIG
jgi:hypothetical protein